MHQVWRQSDPQPFSVRSHIWTKRCRWLIKHGSHSWQQNLKLKTSGRTGAWCIWVLKKTVLNSLSIYLNISIYISLPLSLSLSLYIYRERERERERIQQFSAEFSLSLYIYIKREREREFSIVSWILYYMYAECLQLYIQCSCQGHHVPVQSWWVWAMRYWFTVRVGAM